MNNFLNPYKSFYDAKAECERIFQREFENESIRVTITLFFTHGDKRTVTKHVPVKALDGEHLIVSKFINDIELNETYCFRRGLFEMEYRGSIESCAILANDKDAIVSVESDHETAPFIVVKEGCSFTMNWKHFPITFYALVSDYKTRHQKETMKQLASFK